MLKRVEKEKEREEDESKKGGRGMGNLRWKRGSSKIGRRSEEVSTRTIS